MKTIFKYDIKATDIQDIDMPKGAEVLCVKMQKCKAQLWAKVDTDNDIENRSFLVVGTGNPMPSSDCLRYIDTIQMYEGDLIFHVFESVKVVPAGVYEELKARVESIETASVTLSQIVGNLRDKIHNVTRR